MSLFVGKGNYGIVYRPPLKCADGTEYTCKYIGKLMKYEDAGDEIEGHDIIDPVDPEGEFHILKKEVKHITLFELQKYKIDEEFNTMIVFQYGGLSLDQLKVFDALDGEKFMTKFLKLYDALDVLKKNHLIHCDLKIDNIVMDDDYNFKIIDWTFVLNTKLIKPKTYFNEYPLNEVPGHWNPFIIFYVKKKNIRCELKKWYRGTNLIARWQCGGSVNFVNNLILKNEIIDEKEVFKRFDEFSFGITIFHLIYNGVNLEFKYIQQLREEANKCCDIIF